MAEIVYILCALTSIVCALMLFNKYRKKQTGMLMWSAICFSAFALNNILLVVDLVLFPHFDLVILRTSIMLTGFLSLLYGLIWERA